MNLYLSIVADESKLAEFVHESADAGSGGTNHLSQRFLADVWGDRLRAPFFAEVGRNKSSRARCRSLEFWSIRSSSSDHSGHLCRFNGIQVVICLAKCRSAVCSFNPRSRVPNAAIRLSKRCRPTPANFSMTAWAVWRTAQAPRGRLLRVLLLRLGAVPTDTKQFALLRAKGSIKCPEALNAKKGSLANAIEPDHAGRQSVSASSIRNSMNRQL